MDLIYLTELVPGFTGIPVLSKTSLGVLIVRVQPFTAAEKTKEAEETSEETTEEIVLMEDNMGDSRDRGQRIELHSY